VKTFLGQFIESCLDVTIVIGLKPLEIGGSSVVMIRLIPRCEEKDGPKAEHIATFKNQRLF